MSHDQEVRDHCIKNFGPLFVTWCPKCGVVLKTNSLWIAEVAAQKHHARRNEIRRMFGFKPVVVQVAEKCGSKYKIRQERILS